MDVAFCLQGQGLVVVTRKASLAAAAQRMPASLEALQEHALIPGYVANVVDDACFVSFLSRLTGRAGKLCLLDCPFLPQRSF